MQEWVKINRHLQSVGTATCDVSNLIMNADIMRDEGNVRAAGLLMSAARSVLDYRRRSSRAYGERLSRKQTPKRA